MIRTEPRGDGCQQLDPLRGAWFLAPVFWLLFAAEDALNRFRKPTR